MHAGESKLMDRLTSERCRLARFLLTVLSLFRVNCTSRPVKWPKSYTSARGSVAGTGDARPGLLQ